MKKYNMLRGIVKLMGATLIMCFVGLFLCKTEATAYTIESIEDSEYNETGFKLIEGTDEDPKKIDIYVDDKFYIQLTKGNTGTYTPQVNYSAVLKWAKSNVTFKNGETIKFVLYNGEKGEGERIEDYEGPTVYSLLDSIKLDPDNATAVGNLYNIETKLLPSQQEYFLENDTLPKTVRILFQGTDFSNKVKNKYYVRPDDNRENKNWTDLGEYYDYTIDETCAPGDDLKIFFCPKLALNIYATPSNVSNLKYSDIVELDARVFANEDEEGTGSYGGYEGYEGVIEWWCNSESGVNTRCYPIDEEDGEYAKSSTHYATGSLVGNKFEVAVSTGTEGSAEWMYSIANLSGYPATQKPNPADVYVDFVYQKTGLQLYNNGQPLASGGSVYATEGETLTTLSLKTTNGKSISECYGPITVSPSGSVDLSTGKITIPTVTSSGTYTITASNKETGETETLEFIVRVSGKPTRVELLDGSDEITSGLTLRLNDSNLVFYDKNDNILKGVALKTAIVADEDVLEVKKDNSGVYLVADEPGTTEVQLVLADGTELEEILEITVYPMPTLTYESNRSLKVGMPYKVAIPGSKDSLKQVTGFKLYVYHDDDKLGEFDMSDMGLSSFSSSAKDSTGTRTLTVSAGAVEKIITNLANNGRFSGDSMGITFKAVPIGKRKSGGSTTYETNKDKVFGEDSTTVYRVGISVAGCTVTQSSRYGLSGQEISFTSDQSSTNWTGVGTGGSTTTGSTAKYTVGTNTTTNLALKATANGSSNGSTSPVQPGTNSGGANGTGAGADGLDDVPKTSESNAPMWLIVIVVLAAIGGAYALYLQLRPVTEMGYYDEDEEDRPNF